MQTHENLLQARATLKALQKILKDSDPASGISFAVRRGVARDNEEFENDNIRRPWATLELSDLNLGHSILNSLIEGAKASVLFWENATRRDISEAQRILDEK